MMGAFNIMPREQKEEKNKDEILHLV